MSILRWFRCPRCVRVQSVVESIASGKRSSQRLARFWSHIRECNACRQHYDRTATLMRVFESNTQAEFERTWLECSVMAPWMDETQPAPSKAEHRNRWRWLSGAGLLGAALALVILLPKASFDWTDSEKLRDMASQMTARGSAGGELQSLAVLPVCGEPPRPALRAGCALDESLALSVRRRGDERTGYVAAFGVGVDEELLYYRPRPGDVDLPELKLGTDWTALPQVSRLQVNHQRGLLRVFVLWSEDPISLEDVERMHERVKQLEPTALGGTPWHEAIGLDRFGEICSRSGSCESAEVQLELHP